MKIEMRNNNKSNNICNFLYFLVLHLASIPFFLHNIPGCTFFFLSSITHHLALPVPAQLHPIHYRQYSSTEWSKWNRLLFSIAIFHNNREHIHNICKWMSEASEKSWNSRNFNWIITLSRYFFFSSLRPTHYASFRKSRD